mgnify:CR=1 FL=1
MHVRHDEHVDQSSPLNDGTTRLEPGAAHHGSNTLVLKQWIYKPPPYEKDMHASNHAEPINCTTTGTREHPSTCFQ